MIFSVFAEGVHGVIHNPDGKCEVGRSELVHEKKKNAPMMSPTRTTVEDSKAMVARGAVAGASAPGEGGPATTGMGSWDGDGRNGSGHATATANGRSGRLQAGFSPARDPNPNP